MSHRTAFMQRNATYFRHVPTHVTRACTAAHTGSLDAYSTSQRERGLDALWADVNAEPSVDALTDPIVQGGQGNEPEGNALVGLMSVGGFYAVLTVVGLFVWAVWHGW